VTSIRYRLGINGLNNLAAKYPDQFTDLDADTALDIYFAARAITNHDDEIDNTVLTQIREQVTTDARHNGLRLIHGEQL